MENNKIEMLKKEIEKKDIKYKRFVKLFFISGLMCVLSTTATLGSIFIGDFAVGTSALVLVASGVLYFVSLRSAADLLHKKDKLESELYSLQKNEKEEVEEQSEELIDELVDVNNHKNDNIVSINTTNNRTKRRVLRPDNK